MHMYYGAALSCTAMLAVSPSSKCTDVVNIHPSATRHNGYSLVMTNAAQPPGTCQLSFAMANELSDLETHLNRAQAERSPEVWMMQSEWQWEAFTPCSVPITALTTTLGTYALTNWNTALVRQTNECEPAANVSGILMVSPGNNVCADIVTSDDAVRNNILSFKAVRVRKSIERYAVQMKRNSRIHKKFNYKNLLYVAAFMPVLFVVINTAQSKLHFK